MTFLDRTSVYKLKSLKDGFPHMKNNSYCVSWPMFNKKVTKSAVRLDLIIIVSGWIFCPRYLSNYSNNETFHVCGNIRFTVLSFRCRIRRTLSIKSFLQKKFNQYHSVVKHFRKYRGALVTKSNRHDQYFGVLPIIVMSHGHHSVSEDRQLDCWFNSLFCWTTKETSKPRINGLLVSWMHRWQ